MNSISRWINHSPIIAYFVLTYIISWSLWLVMVALGLDIRTTTGSLLNVLAIAGPSLTALLLTTITGSEKGVRELLSRLSWKGSQPQWYMVALLVPFAIMIIALIISYAMVTPTPVMAGIESLGVLIPEFIRILFFGGPLGEELGWRGYALPRLLEGSSAFKASVILGAIWGLWHLPIYVVSGTGQNDMVRSGGPVLVLFLAFVVWTIGLSILFTWLYKLTNGNLLVAILFHAAINTAVFLPSVMGMQNSPVVMVNAGLTWVGALLVSRSRRFVET